MRDKDSYLFFRTRDRVKKLSALTRSDNRSLILYQSKPDHASYNYFFRNDLFSKVAVVTRYSLEF